MNKNRMTSIADKTNLDKEKFGLSGQRRTFVAAERSSQVFQFESRVFRVQHVVVTAVGQDAAKEAVVIGMV